MGFFISYLRHVCDTSYLVIRYNLNWYKPFKTRRICQEEIILFKEVARSAVKSLLLPHWCQSIVVQLVPKGRTRKGKSQRRKRRYVHILRLDNHQTRGIWQLKSLCWFTALVKMYFIVWYGRAWYHHTILVSVWHALVGSIWMNTSKQRLAVEREKRKHCPLNPKTVTLSERLPKSSISMTAVSLSTYAVILFLHGKATQLWPFWPRRIIPFG